MFTLTGFADEIAMDLNVQMDTLEKLDIHHIEMRGVDGKNLSDCTIAEAKDIKRRLDERGFSLSAIGSPIGKIGIDQPFEAHLDKFKTVIELAHIMQTRYIRMFSFFIPEGNSPDCYADEVFARWDGFLTAAKGSGLILLHENEKGIYGDTAVRCKTLFDTMKNPALRATFDPANFVQCGITPCPDAYKLLKPYIEYVHIKDARAADGTIVPAGQGDGTIPELLAALKKDGYDGFLSLEPHLADFDGFSALEKEADTNKADKSMGGALFCLATDALKTILNQL
ncbi:MAG: sugar phosphate isomerase/epimerase [Ruminococcaceae bacterium]|nr:sugar phosphate isomerase/epimerase [Oscillospiraceae bacterium]